MRARPRSTTVDTTDRPQGGPRHDHRDEQQRGHHRPRGARRPRGHPVRRRHRGVPTAATSSTPSTTPSSPGTTRRAPGPSSTSSTRRPRTPSGTARPTSRGTPTSTRRSWSSRRPRPRAATPSASTSPGTPLEKWGDKEWVALGVESQNWTLSQFLHGEQGALICTAKIVESVPWIDAKYYASTQVMDEARHVEVFAKYLDEKLSGHYPVNAHLRMLLDDIIADSRWDMTYLGMQIMIEGLALAAFGFMHAMTPDPLLKQLLRYVMADEARHVAFGVLSLQEYYAGADRRRAPRAPGVRLRGGRPHARPLPPAGGVGPDGRSTQGRSSPSSCRLPTAPSSRRCCSPRSSPTAASSACSTPPTAGCGPSSPSWVSSSSSRPSTPPRSTTPWPPCHRPSASWSDPGSPDGPSGRRRPPGAGGTAAGRPAPARGPVLLVACGSVSPLPTARRRTGDDRAPIRVGGDRHGHPVRRPTGRSTSTPPPPLARHLADTGSEGIVVAGTTGEGRC